MYGVQKSLLLVVMAFLVWVVPPRFPAPHLTALWMGQSKRLPKFQMKHRLVAPAYRLFVGLVLAVCRLLRELVVPLVVLPVLPVPSSVPSDELQQGAASPVQLWLVSVLTGPVLATVLRQLGPTWSFYLVVGLVVVVAWPSLVRWNSVSVEQAQLPSRWWALHWPVAWLASLVTFPAWVYASIRRPALLLFVLPRVWAFLVTPTPSLWPVVAVVLSAGLVTLLHDPRLWIARTGTVCEQPDLMEWPSLCERQGYVKGEL